jgi:hypothetical protein
MQNYNKFLYSACFSSIFSNLLLLQSLRRISPCGAQRLPKHGHVDVFVTKLSKPTKQFLARKVANRLLSGGKAVAEPHP